MTQYYMPDLNIVSREQLQCSESRNGKAKRPAPTIQIGCDRTLSCYTSKYALSDQTRVERVRDALPPMHGHPSVRKYPSGAAAPLNYGTKYCHDSPTIKEEEMLPGGNSAAIQLRHE